MTWTKLESSEQLQRLKNTASEKPALIFKHSSRCSISKVALERLERKWNPAEMEGVNMFFLDLIKYPEISQLIASEFSVYHESPQVLMIENGKSVYDRSHFEINYEELAAVATRNFKN